MKRWAFLAALALIGAVALPSVSAPRRHTEKLPVERATGPAFTDRSLLIRLRPDAPGAKVRGEIRSLGGKILSDIPALDTLRVRMPTTILDRAQTDLAHMWATRYVEREGLGYASATPDDPYFPWSGSNVKYGGQWGDGLTKAQAAWDITKGSPDVIVAVVDSGIDDAHPDLAGQLVTGTSIVGGSTIDTHGHGEYVAGVIAPNTNNGVGVAGYCWGCRLMPVKITNSSSATYGDMASGIVWAVNHGARVINVSYAGTSSSSTLDAAVSYATDHGAVVVGAAGNSGCNCPSYPAASPGAIAVAASDQSDDLMTYSNFGSWVQVAAPTGDITTWLTLNGQPYGYAPVGGTSISAPVVSGILALMLSYDPSATPAELKGALFSSTDAITGLTQSGAPVSVRYGRVNAYRALLALGVSTPTSDPSPSPTSSPSPTTSPSQTASPSPSDVGPSPDPSTTGPSPTPTILTMTFSGALNRKHNIKTFSVSVGSGPADAELSFTKCPTLALSLGAADTTLDSTSGPSVVVLDRTLPAGSYSYVVSGSDRCSFSLTVSAAA
jgi:subtilisin family serine protease